MFVIDIKLWRLQIDHGMSAFRGMSALYSNRRLWSIIVRTWTILLMIVLWLYFKFLSCTVNTFALRSFVSNRLFYNLLVQIYVVSSKDQKKIWIDNLKNVKYVVPQISKIVMVKRHYVLVANSFTSDPLKGWGRKFYITCIISTQAKALIQRRKMHKYHFVILQIQFVFIPLQLWWKMQKWCQLQLFWRLKKPL